MSNTQHVPPSLDPLQRYSIPEAIALLRSSRRTIYAAIKRGDLRTIRENVRTRKNGREYAGRTFVPGSEIVRLSAAPARPS